MVNSKCPSFVGIRQYPSEEHFGGDAYGFYLEIDGEKASEWGDTYHDDGRAKLQGFVEGYCYALGIEVPPSIEWKERADYPG